MTIDKTVYKRLKMQVPHESVEAKKFWQWAQYHKIAKDYLFAIPNGGSRNVIEAKNMKAQGVRAGVSDYMLAYPHHGENGLFIELKRANKTISKLSKEQAVWLGRVHEIGYGACVAYGADEAIKAVEDYLR